jgi:hypothetical protein
MGWGVVTAKPDTHCIVKQFSRLSKSPLLCNAAINISSDKQYRITKPSLMLYSNQHFLCCTIQNHQLLCYAMQQSTFPPLNNIKSQTSLLCNTAINISSVKQYRITNSSVMQYSNQHFLCYTRQDHQLLLYNTAINISSVI